MVTEFQQYLKSLGASQDFFEWVGDQTAKQAWDACERPDWLIWLAAKAGIDQKVIVRLACRFARISLEYITPAEPHFRVLETIEAWCDGTSTTQEVDTALQIAHNLSGPSTIPAYAATAHAATAMTYAANLDSFAIDTAIAASIAAGTTAFTVSVYDTETSGDRNSEKRIKRAKAFQLMAAIVREYISFPLIV